MHAIHPGGATGDMGVKPHSPRCVWDPDVDTPTSSQCRRRAVPYGVHAHCARAGRGAGPGSHSNI
jgi:hypothetical protein